MHKMLAMVTKNPLWEISLDDGKRLAGALIDVMKYHSISIDPKYLAYGKLIFIGTAIYAPRVALMAAQAKAKKEAAEKATVFDSDGRPIVG